MSVEVPANAAADAANSSDFADAADAAVPPNGEPPRGALVLLCGLPAAGKSTLAARLLSDGPSALRAALGGDVRVWHLCFDRLLIDLQAARGVERFDPELWHEARARALGAVHEFFGRATGESAAATDAAAADGDAPPPLEQLAPSERTNGGAAPPFEVVVVDDHITGVVSEHQAGKVIDWQETGIKIVGRRSTPGRYFQVAEPGLGWGGTNIEDPLTILGDWNAAKGARAGLTLLMVSTTGEQFAYYVLDDDLVPQPAPLPEALQATVDLITENCEPALCTVLFMGGAGGSLRAGATRNPVKLTRSVQKKHTAVSCGGVPAYVWPGGGITIMVDVLNLPDNAFGYVPTPALVAPLEFTVRREDYHDLGGHDAAVRSIGKAIEDGSEYGASSLVLGPGEKTLLTREDKEI